MKGTGWGTIILLVLAYVFFKSCIGCGDDSSSSSLKGQGDYIINCSSCGKKFRSTDPSPKWCPDCSAEEQTRKFNRDVKAGKYPDLY